MLIKVRIDEFQWQIAIRVQTTGHFAGRYQAMVTAFPRAQTIVPVALITPPGLMMAETILRNAESEIASSLCPQTGSDVGPSHLARPRILAWLDANLSLTTWRACSL
jgi:hypothetical protein